MNSKPSQPKTLLGFDYGMKSIGIAVGQTVTKTAQALTAIQAENGEPDWQQIDKLVQTWHPDAMVVGVPLNMDGTPQNITQAAKQFAEKLRKKFKLPVHEVDERLTTIDARNQLFEEKGYKGLSKSAVDALSAKLILENFINNI